MRRTVMASKSFRLSLIGYFQLLPAARQGCPRAFDAEFRLNLHGVFEGGEARPS